MTHALAAVILVIGLPLYVFPGLVAEELGTRLLSGAAIGAACTAPLLAGSRSIRLFLAIVGGCVTLGWMRWPEASISHYAGTTLGALVMVIHGGIFTTFSRLRWAVVFFLAGGAFVLAVGILAVPDYYNWPRAIESVFSVGLPRITGKIRLPLRGLEGGAVNPNALAAAALLLMPMALNLLFARLRGLRDRLSLLPLAGLVALIGAVVILISHSWTAGVAIWCTAAISMMLIPTSSISRILAGLVIAGPIVAAVAVYSVSGRAVVVEELTEAWLSLGTRTDLYRQGLAQLDTSPWLGVGINSFRERYVASGAISVGEIPAHAHNIFLQTALDIGVIGSLAFWGLQCSLWRRAVSVATRALPLIRGVALGAALSLMAITVFGLTDAVALGAKLGFCQWVLGGFILAAQKIADDDPLRV